MFNLFTVVQWGSGTCIAPSGEVGNCLPPGECQYRQGIPGGPCAGGYGTCCVCEWMELLGERTEFIRCSVILHLQLWPPVEMLYERTVHTLSVQNILISTKAPEVVN